MKIIGKTRGGFLIEASDNEIKLVQGYKTNASSGYHTPDIGMVFNVQKIDKISRFVRNLDDDKLQFIKGQLLIAIKNLDEAAEVANALTLFETLAEDDKS